MCSSADQDPFHHGIGRYVPWQAEIKDNRILANLEGKEVWKEQSLASHEGQAFKMTFAAKLDTQGLSLDLSIVSETDSLIGIDYYLAIPPSLNSTLTASTARLCMDGKEKKEVDSLWTRNSMGEIVIPLHESSIDCTFYPSSNPLEGSAVLNTSLYNLGIRYSCSCQENCWRIVHDKKDDFIRFQVLSSQDPCHPNLTVSSLSIFLIPL